MILSEALESMCARSSGMLDKKGNLRYIDPDESSIFC